MKNERKVTKKLKIKFQENHSQIILDSKILNR